MPIKRMLKGRNFNPQSAAILVKAFNDIVDELDLRTLADRNRAATIVIRLAASRTVLDVEWLRAEAASTMRNELALSVSETSKREQRHIVQVDRDDLRSRGRRIRGVALKDRDLMLSKRGR